MSAQAEKYLNEAATVHNIGKNGRLIQKAKRYLRTGERIKREEELKRLNEMLAPANIAASKMGMESVKAAARHRSMVQEDLEDNSPPTDLSGETRDAIARRIKALETEIIPTLQPTDIMRRNPVGAVDRWFKGEGSAKIKAKIKEWKNLQMLQNPDSDERDIANVERLRPQGYRLDGAPTFMAEAQIPGVFAMTPAAKENWPVNMPELGTANSALKQAEERELREQIEQLKAQLAAKDSERSAKRAKKDEQKLLARERMQKYWAAKKAAKNEGV